MSVPPQSLKARWTPLRLGSSPLLQRSSHSVGVVGDRAYIFGGEREARTPVGAELLVVGLKDDSLRVLHPSGLWPSPRVGAATAVLDKHIYLWGGRGGREMTPLLGEEEDGFWRFDTESEVWERLEGKAKDEAPEGRSYHTMTSDGKETLYVHAGCPSKGRLSTLHSFHLPTQTWRALPSAPDPARGGTVLAHLPSTSTLARFGGFAGYELGPENGGGLDTFDIPNASWKTVSPSSDAAGEANPDKRSVQALVGVEQPLIGGGATVRALMWHGESGPAPPELGHAGAGLFHSDVWVLLSSQEDPTALSWRKIDLDTSVSQPEPRGWLAASSWHDGVTGKWRGVMFGGLNSRNERLADAWVLDIDQGSA